MVIHKRSRSGTGPHLLLEDDMNRTHFGNALRKRRIEKGLSQHALAERLGVSYATVNRWECGRNLPSRMAREKIDVIFHLGGHKLA
jgi:DNA-binding transcriptional regulator YiaG